MRQLVKRKEGSRDASRSEEQIRRSLRSLLMSSKAKGRRSKKILLFHPLFFWVKKEEGKKLWGKLARHTQRLERKVSERQLSRKLMKKIWIQNHCGGTEDCSSKKADEQRILKDFIFQCACSRMWHCIPSFLLRGLTWCVTRHNASPWRPSD